MDATEAADGKPRGRISARLDRIVPVLAGLTEGFLAIFAGFSPAGQAVLALGAAFWFVLAWVLHFRSSMLRGRRTAAALVVGVALMFVAAAILQATLPSDRPDMPTVKRTDVQAARGWAVDSCGAYAHAVFATAELPRDAPRTERERAAKEAAAARAESASDAEKAAGFDRRWQPLYVAAWRINARWRGNTAINDDLYRKAVTAVHKSCQQLTDARS